MPIIRQAGPLGGFFGGAGQAAAAFGAATQQNFAQAMQVEQQLAQQKQLELDNLYRAQQQGFREQQAEIANAFAEKQFDYQLRKDERDEAFKREVRSADEAARQRQLGLAESTAQFTREEAAQDRADRREQFESMEAREKRQFDEQVRQFDTATEEGQKKFDQAVRQYEEGKTQREKEFEANQQQRERTYGLLTQRADLDERRFGLAEEGQRFDQRFREDNARITKEHNDRIAALNEQKFTLEAKIKSGTFDINQRAADQAYRRIEGAIERENTMHGLLLEDRERDKQQRLDDRFGFMTQSGVEPVTGQGAYNLLNRLRSLGEGGAYRDSVEQRFTEWFDERSGGEFSARGRDMRMLSDPRFTVDAYRWVSEEIKNTAGAKQYQARTQGVDSMQNYLYRMYPELQGNTVLANAIASAEAELLNMEGTAADIASKGKGLRGALFAVANLERTRMQVLERVKAATATSSDAQDAAPMMSLEKQQHIADLTDELQTTDDPLSVETRIMTLVDPKMAEAAKVARRQAERDMTLMGHVRSVRQRIMAEDTEISPAVPPEQLEQGALENAIRPELPVGTDAQDDVWVASWLHNNGLDKSNPNHIAGGEAALEQEKQRRAEAREKERKRKAIEEGMKRSPAIRTMSPGALFNY